MSKRKLEEFGFSSLKKRDKFKYIIDNGSSKVIYIEDFLSKEEEHELLKDLSKIQFKKEIIKMWGKEIVAPRTVFSFGDDGISYGYARKKERSTEWSTKMKQIRNMVFEKSCEFGDNQEVFNFVLLNKYENGSSYMGLHNDNESGIISESCIASLSIGADRLFNFVEIGTKEKTSIILKSGSLLLMLGATQKEYKHELPKTKIPCGERYNLTFRHLKHKIK